MEVPSLVVYAEWRFVYSKTDMPADARPPFPCKGVVPGVRNNRFICKFRKTPGPLVTTVPFASTDHPRKKNHINLLLHNTGGIAFKAKNKGNRQKI